MFFGLFKKKSKPAISEQSYAVSGTNIHYKPNLISNLEDDHVSLLNLYGNIKAASESGNYKKTAEFLSIFRDELEDHLLKENINLYIYLTHQLKGDALNTGLISKFRKEMNGIATLTLRFLEKYESIDSNIDLQKEFAEEFAFIGNALGKRIKREESMLYTLYAPPY
ncbi:MAG TPA: hemerythrin domain-containing protein [Gammaproteobacteria bacterium]|nr:hemerythrin domain-containing protein [Gammaproteobacteria bacterium]